MSDVAEQYLQQHKLRELTAEWLKRLADERPDDPLKALETMIEQYRCTTDAYVCCENPWCGACVPAFEYDDHLRICTPDRWNKCLRCDERVEVSKMPQHRLNCHMKTCNHCGEYVLPRMLKLCPLEVLKGLSMRVERAELQRTASQVNSSPCDRKVRHLQRLWRTAHAQRNFRRLAFKVMWNMIDNAREVKLAHGMLQQSSSSATLQRFHGSSSALRAPGSVEMTTAECEARIQAAHPPEELISLIDAVARGETIDFPVAQDIIQDAAKILALRPGVVHVATPYNGEVVVVGDLHGQLKDLLHILRTEGLPGEKKRFIFNGDFVDRGPHGCEVLTLIFAMLCTTPSAVFLNRGNHEDQKVNREYGFLVEIRAKYGDESDNLYDDMLKAFKVMPLVHVIDRRVMVVHGGLPRTICPLERINNIGHIRAIPTVEQVDEDEEILVDLVWSDPVERFKSRHLGMRYQGKHWRISARGCGIEYVAQHTKEFLEANSLELVIRSHEMVASGYESCHEGRCFTVFSASDYCGVSGNRGAICVFTYLQPDPVWRTWYLREGSMPREDTNGSFFDTPVPGDPSGSGTVALGAMSAGPAAGLISVDNKHPDAECIDTLRQLRELIWQNRYRLMTNFCTADPEQSGYISKVEWCEVMRRTLELDIKWYMIARYLTDIIVYAEVPSVRYTQFLTSIDSRCSSMFLSKWIEHMVPDVFSRLELPHDFIPSNPVFAKQVQRRRSSQLLNSPRARALSPTASDEHGGGSGRPPLTPAPSLPSCGAPPAVRFARGVFAPTGSGLSEDSLRVPDDWQSIKVDFNFFVSRVRTKSVVASKMEDSELFVLFTYFDRNLDGHIILGEFVADVKRCCEARARAARKARKLGGQRDGEGAATDSSDSLVDSGSGSDDDDGEEVQVMDLGDMTLDAFGGDSTAAKAAVQQVKESIVITRQEECKEAWIYRSFTVLQKFFLYGRTRGLEASFHLLDRDHSGSIDFNEFRKMLRHLNSSLPTPLKEDQMAEMFKVIDLDNSGELDLQEFVRYFSVVDMRYVRRNSKNGFVAAIRDEVEKSQSPFAPPPTTSVTFAADYAAANYAAA